MNSDNEADNQYMGELKEETSVHAEGGDKWMDTKVPRWAFFIMLLQLISKFHNQISNSSLINHLSQIPLKPNTLQITVLGHFASSHVPAIILFLLDFCRALLNLSSSGFWEAICHLLTAGLSLRWRKVQEVLANRGQASKTQLSAH